MKSKRMKPCHLAFIFAGIWFVINFILITLAGWDGDGWFIAFMLNLPSSLLFEGILPMMEDIGAIHAAALLIAGTIERYVEMYLLLKIIQKLKRVPDGNIIEEDKK